MGPYAAVDALEMLHDPKTNPCDYLRAWELLYDSGPIEYKSVGHLTRESIPADVMRRVRLGEETADDVILAARFVARWRDHHDTMLRHSLSWTQWACWTLDSVRAAVRALAPIPTYERVPTPSS